MSPLPLALALALTQAPCEGERVVLVPLQPVVLSAAEARQLEDTVRRAAERLPGTCLQSRAETLTRVRATGGRLAGCADAACRGAQVRALDADRLVRGVALGVGGGRSVALTLVDREGLEAQATLELDAAGPGTAPDEARALDTLRALWGTPAPGVAKSWRPWPTVLWAAGGVALAAGVGFGLAARRTQTQLSTGTAGCAGEGPAFRDCIAGQLDQGRTRARASNALVGAGALLGAGGTLLFVWETP